MGEQVQFHGKWPFHRLDFSSLPLVPFFPLRILGLVLPRLQEPLSVVFSLANLYAHYVGLESLRTLRRRARMQEGRRLARVYEVYAWSGLNAWVWSCVFHARDVDWTERADYFAAAGTMIAGLWIAVVRIQGWYASSSKGKTLAPSQRRAALAWTASLVALFVLHCAYLGLRDRFDYTYNMRFNVVVALATIALWALWTLAQSRLPTPSNFSRRQLSSYPSARARFRAPHHLAALPPLVLLPALTALEVLDFSPVGPFGLRLLDAHALWHASTVPVVRLWYAFLIRDVRWIDGQGEGGDPSEVLPRVPASGGTGTERGRGRDEREGGEGGDGGAQWVLEKVLREGRRMTGLGTGAGLGIFGGFGAVAAGEARSHGAGKGAAAQDKAAAGAGDAAAAAAEAARDGRRD